MSDTQREIRWERGRVDVGYTKRNTMGERESRCRINKQKCDGEKSPLYI
jgi:hypothetical protein